MAYSRLKDIIEETVEESISSLHDRINHLERLLESSGLNDRLDKMAADYREINETISRSQKQLLFMTSEAKGIVSMSRASLHEGKEFMQMVRDQKDSDSMTNLAVVKAQICEGKVILELDDGNIRTIRMSPELQKSMKKRVKEYEAAIKKISDGWAINDADN